MSETVIPSGGAVTLTSPLPLGASVTFANAPASGTLAIEPSAFTNTTVVNNGTSIISTYLGGPILGFAAGDTIEVVSLSGAYAAFDHAPDSTAQNASISTELSDLALGESFLGVREIITISSAGVVSDNTGLLEGHNVDGLSLSATEISEISGFAAGLETALLGTPAAGTDLFITLSPNAGDTDVNGILTTDGTFVICYLQGTAILTPEGERPVESLQAGDLLVTRDAGLRRVRWMGRQSFDPRFVKQNLEQIPVRIKAGALGTEQPARDLFVSPGHSMLLDGVLVLAKHLINGVTIRQELPAGPLHYYLMDFGPHDCVLAEGAWAESYADAEGLRAQFHNAAGFFAAYPAHVAPPAPLLCAPRPTQGPDLEAALAPVVARAAALRAPGRLEGFVDDIQAGIISGWARDVANPDLPVRLELVRDGVCLGEVLACQPRADLRAAGFGFGHCAFSFAAGAEPDQAIIVRRMSDGAILPAEQGLAERLRA